MLNKKLRATVLTLVLASTIISGCANSGAAAQTTTQTSAERVTEENKEKTVALAYLNELRDMFHAYAEASSSYSENITAEKYDDARKDLENMKNALNDLENIVAPEKYSVDQSRLRGHIRPEQDYVNLCGRFLEFCEKKDSLTEEDEIELKGLTEEMALSSDSGLLDEFTNVVKKVKADIEEETEE